ncbi:hypothetical protein [Thiohalorhabdus methylotrophus]|uniref:hypothetical protein n=1 Tax=Thiohalorhabdus methylotrophus TaxID=3242694 RepID=UPI003B21A5A0
MGTVKLPEEGGTANAGLLSIIGVYPPMHRSFPTGQAMSKNLTLPMGNCNHRQYIPGMVELVKNGSLDPEGILTRREPVTNVLEAYSRFDERRPGWGKVALQ